MSLSVSEYVFCVSVIIVRLVHTLAKTINVKNDVCRFLHLSSNSLVAFHDLDLLFGGKEKYFLYL